MQETRRWWIKKAPTPQVCTTEDSKLHVTDSDGSQVDINDACSRAPTFYAVAGASQSDSRAQITINDIKVIPPAYGARYYGSALGRFPSPDWSAKPVLVPYANLADPQSFNLYSYVRNNPLGKADPDGHCSAPSALKSGQVGVCIDYFISTKHVDEGMKLGHLGYGHNRGPTGTDTQGRYRTEVQLTITPRQSVDLKATPGISKTMVGPDLAGKQDTQSGMKVDDKGNMHIDLQTTSINGYQAHGLPGPSGSIQGDVKLVITPDGKVGTDAGGTRTPYPALEIYKYAPGQNPTQVLYAPQSSTSDDLNRGRVTPIPQVAPQ